VHGGRRRCHPLWSRSSRTCKRLDFRPTFVHRAALYVASTAVGRSVSGPHLPRSHRHIGVNSGTSAVAEGEGTPMTQRVIGGIVQEHGRSGASEGVSA
jgi:hypothetical protein